MLNDNSALKKSLKKLKVIYKEVAVVKVNLSYYRKKPKDRMDNIVEQVTWKEIVDKVDISRIERLFNVLKTEIEVMIQMLAEGVRGNLDEFETLQKSVIELEEKRAEIEKSVYKTTQSEASGGCYVATYCFGKESWEYAFLISYRDRILIKSKLGRWLVGFYYKISPLMIRRAGDSEFVKDIFRKFIHVFIKVLKIKF